MSVSVWGTPHEGSVTTTIAGAAPGGDAPDRRGTWVEVDLDAIGHNVNWLKQRSTAPLLLAAVKAEGYGHGAVPVARAALQAGADWLGVAMVEEGRQLRRAGITAPILLFSEPQLAAVDELLALDLTPALYSPPMLAALEDAGRRRGESVAVHLKLDTGMRRVGVPESEWEDALKRVLVADGVALDGVWSHLATADEPENPFARQQLASFQQGVALARRLGAIPRLVHLCNSAGTVTLPEGHFDMVRPGLAVYGLDPAPGTGAAAGLRPALSWFAEVSLVKRLAAGEGVSYGLRWTAPRDTTVATVPAGYADGVRRALTNVGAVAAAGGRAPIAGTVCMDQFLVDLGDRGGADRVALIGEVDGVRVTAEDWAAWLSTISYEVVTGIGPRVPRVYRGG